MNAAKFLIYAVVVVVSFCYKKSDFGCDVCEMCASNFYCCLTFFILLGDKDIPGLDSD